MPALRTVVLFGATLTTGLGTGLFYSYACSVMPGLARADDRSFVEVMQQINAAILNGWFMLSFLGALVLICVAGVLELRGGGGSRRVLLWIAAAAVFQLAMLVITGVVNVPLNNRLAAAGAPDRIADPPRRPGRLRDHLGPLEPGPRPHLHRRLRLHGLGPAALRPHTRSDMSAPWAGHEPAPCLSQGRRAELCARARVATARERVDGRGAS